MWLEFKFVDTSTEQHLFCLSEFLKSTISFLKGYLFVSNVFCWISIEPASPLLLLDRQLGCCSSLVLCLYKCIYWKLGEAKGSCTFLLCVHCRVWLHWIFLKLSITKKHIPWLVVLLPTNWTWCLNSYKLGPFVGFAFSACHS